MKRILIAIMSIVLVAGLTGGAFAYFSDTESQASNSFVSGTLTLDDTAWGTPGAFSLTGKVPGDTLGDAKNYVLTNSGNVPGDLYMRIVLDSDTGSLGEVITATSTNVPAIDGETFDSLSTWLKIADLDETGGTTPSKTVDLTGTFATTALNAKQGQTMTFTVQFALIQDGGDIANYDATHSDTDLT